MNYLKLWILLREDLEKEVVRSEHLLIEDTDDPWIAEDPWLTMLVAKYEKAAFQKVLKIMKSKEYELAAE